MLVSNSSDDWDRNVTDAILGLRDTNRDRVEQFQIVWTRTDVYSKQAQKVFETLPLFEGEYSMDYRSGMFCLRIDNEICVESDNGNFKDQEKIQKVFDNDKFYVCDIAANDSEKMTRTIGVCLQPVNDPYENWLEFTCWIAETTTLEKAYIEGEFTGKVAAVNLDEENKTCSVEYAFGDGARSVEVFSMSKGGLVSSLSVYFPSGKLSYQKTFEITEVEAGIFFPSRFEIEFFDESGNAENKKTFSLDLDRSRFNDECSFAEDTFKVSIGPGNRIIDRRSYYPLNYFGDEGLKSLTRLEEELVKTGVVDCR